MPTETMKQSFAKILFVAIVFAFAATACAPIVATRGNFLEDERLAAIQQGVSTKEEVAKKLGSPTTIDPFDDKTWFYIGEKTSQTAFFDPKIDARKVIIMKFNEDGVLDSAQQVDEKSGKEIDIVTKQTSTPGKDNNMFQQFLGNLGKFNSGQGSQLSPGR